MITLLEFLQKKHIEADPDFIDLGLPSGTLWHNCNLGANNAKEIGDYYAWGEIKPKKNFSTYEYAKNNDLTKYNDSDKKEVLDNEDDAAYIESHGSMKIPSFLQADELLKNTTVDFYKDYFELTSKINEKKLIFPNSKTCVKERYFIGDNGNVIRLWINKRSIKYNADANILVFDHDFNVCHITTTFRYFGLNIRPVKA